MKLTQAAYDAKFVTILSVHGLEVLDASGYVLRYNPEDGCYGVHKVRADGYATPILVEDGTDYDGDYFDPYVLERQGAPCCPAPWIAVEVE